MAITFTGHVMSEIVVPSGVTASVTTEAAGPTSVAITAGTYPTLTEFLDQLATDFDAGQPPSGGSGWDFDINNEGIVSIEADGDEFSIAFSPTARALLGFNNNPAAVTVATGDWQARGIWVPDCPLFIDGNYKAAPRSTDTRQSVTPTGRVFAHVGNVRYRHRGLRWSHVAAPRVWMADETTFNTSFERFWLDTQCGQGHAWFTPSSRITILAHTNDQIGSSATVMGSPGSVLRWSIVGGADMEQLVKRIDQWDGHWLIELPELLSDGS